jgi:hypothetical protein
MKCRVLRPWKKRFRGSKRYYARLERTAAAFRLPFDRADKVDFHEHFDIDGHGRRGFRHRRLHLRAMFVAFRRVLDQAARLDGPLHVFAYIGTPTWHSDGDALVVISPDVDPDPFSGVKWDDGVPGFLREHVHGQPYQVGLVERPGYHIYFVRRRE